VVEGAHGVAARVDGRDCVTFCSNDYLGLASHPRLRAALQKAAEHAGVGSGAAQLITGYNSAHQQLERELAEFVQRPRALLFSTGYQCNMGVISALLGKGDHVYSDSLNHASLIDGCRLSGADIHRYGHADVGELRSQLAAPAAGHRLIVTDALFSMDGDRAPLRELADVACNDNAWLMVDDAHGFGVLGPEGRGSVAAAGLDGGDVPILTATLGKSLGAFGAFVAGSEELIETLIQSARTFIFTTALPPVVAEAAREALKVMRDEPWRREHLHALIARFRAGARERGLPIAESSTPIQPLVVGDEQRALDLSRALWEAGFLVTAIRPPTVPPGTCRLRITLSAAHGESQVDGLIEALARIIG
jgi:8-amino-7-oxononanoate synthase